MKVKSIPSGWMRSDGRRLDCGPYMSGALEAKIQLEELTCRKERLAYLTKGHNGGIYNGPQFVRNFVDDSAYGVPFLGTSSMLRADLSDLPLLRKRDAYSPKLSYLRIEPRMTLISCSGTIGRMVYARPDMDGIWSNQDILKVVPDQEKVPSGYLYAFLSSKFGVPLVTSGTYGAIIPHIEPQHIADLPVPRLGDGVEHRVHELVEQAAFLRAEASFSLSLATSNVEAEIGAPPQRRLSDDPRKMGNAVGIKALHATRRLEAFYYNPVATDLDRWIANHPNGYWRLDEAAHVFDVPPFKHIYVGAEHGVPFYTSGDLFKLNRAPEKYLSRTRTRDLHKYVIESGWVLVARSGQLGGIIGRPQFADSALHASTASDHVIRIVPQLALIPAGYLWAYLSTTTVGYTLLTRTMTGASVPALWPKYLNEVRVIKARSEFMAEIDDRVRAAFENRVKATALEDRARALVERAIEEAA